MPPTYHRGHRTVRDRAKYSTSSGTSLLASWEATMPVRSTKFHLNYSCRQADGAYSSSARHSTLCGLFLFKVLSPRPSGELLREVKIPTIQFRTTGAGRMSMNFLSGRIENQKTLKINSRSAAHKFSRSCVHGESWESLDFRNN